MAVFETPAPVAADIQVQVGAVHIIASEREDTVVVVNPSKPGKKLDVEAAEKTVVEMTRSRLTVITPKPGGLGGLLLGRYGSVDVTVELPEGSSIDLTNGYGDLRADGSFGEVFVKTGAGDIDVDQATACRLVSGAGRLSLGSCNGKAEVTTAGDMEIRRVTGEAAIKNLNGKTRVGEVVGPLRVRSANGDIFVERARADVSAKTANGDVEIGEVTLGMVTLDTSSGSISVGLASGTAAWVDARTQYGKVHNELESGDRPGSGKEVEIRARTSFGDIRIHRSRRTTTQRGTK